ncbi:hypothetical protein QAD02_009605, partial [Eretmocerus hayati]
VKSRWASSTVVAGSLAILTLGRLRVGGGRAPEFASADNPVARHPSRLTRGLTFLYLPAASLGMLLCPCSLSFDWSMNAVPLVSSIRDPRNLESLLLYGTLFGATLWALRARLASSSTSSQACNTSVIGNGSNGAGTTATTRSRIRYSSNGGASSDHSWPLAGLTKQEQLQLYAWRNGFSEGPRCPVCSGRRAGNCHTDGCRAINNNNNGPVAECHCPLKRKQLLTAMSSTTSMATNFSITSSFPHFVHQLHHHHHNHDMNFNMDRKSTVPNLTGTNRRCTTKLVGSPGSVLAMIGFLVLPFLPASNLFFYVGFVLAERILYLPSVGACLAVGAAIARAHQSARARNRPRLAALVLLLTALMLGCMSARTLLRNADWLNEENLYRSALRINPPKAYGNLGSVLSAQGRVNEAEQAFVEALRHRPNMADVHYNLGILQQGRRNYQEAILSYQRAIHFRPSLAQAYVNLGATLASVGRGEEAAAVLRAGANLDGSALKDRRAHEAARVQALLQLGSLHAEQGRLNKALASYRQALVLMPEHYPPQSVYNLLGETLSRMQQYNEAEKWFQASLASQPDHVPAHITYGKLLARNSSRVSEAERWFLRARRLAPHDPSVHHHYGLFLSTQGRLAEAAESHLEAASLSRSDYELVLGAASALRRASRCQEAEHWYRHLLRLRPHEARSHANLGAILHLNGKYRQAAAAYREALRLQPGDPTTITNLHKLAALLA